MARSVIRLSEAESEVFHANYSYMWKKLNTAPYYVSGYGETPEWINSTWLLPSYVNLSKCLNPSFTPSMNIVNKIVQFYNANISPAVDTYMFLNEYLEKGDSKRGLFDNSGINKLTGLYYGYYYAGIEDQAQIYGCVISIFNDGNYVSAYMVAGLTDDDTLTDPEIKKMIGSNDFDYLAYDEFRKKLPLAKQRTTIYTGPVTYSPGIMTLTLKDFDKENVFLNIRIPVSNEVGDRYIGGLGVITMVKEDFNIQFLKLGIERADDAELKALKLSDSKLLDLLSIKKAVNEHIYLQPNDNVRWTDNLITAATH